MSDDVRKAHRATLSQRERSSITVAYLVALNRTSVANGRDALPAFRTLRRFGRSGTVRSCSNSSIGAVLRVLRAIDDLAEVVGGVFDVG